MKTFEQIEQAAKIAVKALDDKFGKDITILRIDGISSLADFFLIATAGNPNQLSAMAREVEEKLYKEAGMQIHHLEGQHEGEWLLMDFADIVVHLFNKESREFYNLERIWKDAEIIKAEDFLKK